MSAFTEVGVVFHCRMERENFSVIESNSLPCDSVEKFGYLTHTGIP